MAQGGFKIQLSLYWCAFPFLYTFSYDRKCLSILAKLGRQTGITFSPELYNILIFIYFSSDGPGFKMWVKSFCCNLPSKINRDAHLTKYAPENAFNHMWQVHIKAVTSNK